MRVRVVMRFLALAFAIAAVYLLTESQSTTEWTTRRLWELRYNHVAPDGKREWRWRQYDIEMKYPEPMFVGEPVTVFLEASAGRAWRMRLDDEGRGVAAPTPLDESSETQCPMAFRLKATCCDIDSGDSRSVDEHAKATMRLTARSSSEQSMRLTMDDAQTRLRIAAIETGFDGFSDSHGTFNHPLAVSIRATDRYWNRHVIGGLGLLVVSLAFVIGPGMLNLSRMSGDDHSPAAGT